MSKKIILILATTLIFTSTSLLNCGQNSNVKKQCSISSKSNFIKEKNKKETLEETKYYVNKSYYNLLAICKEWQSLKELIKEKNDENIKKNVFLIFSNIKNTWIQIEKRAVPKGDKSESFSNELKFIKDKQLNAIDCFTKGINNKNSEFINEGFKYLKESNNYIYSDIIPYIDEINTTIIN